MDGPGSWRPNAVHKREGGCKRPVVGLRGKGRPISLMWHQGCVMFNNWDQGCIMRQKRRLSSSSRSSSSSPLLFASLLLNLAVSLLRPPAPALLPSIEREMRRLGGDGKNAFDSLTLDSVFLHVDSMIYIMFDLD